MAFVAILITIIIIVPIAIVCTNMRNKLLSEGKIVNRDIHFVENAEIFTFRKPVDYSPITNGVMNFDYKDIRCALSGDKARQTYNFKGADWSANLWYVGENAEAVTYRFEFNNWSSRNGIPYSALAMNKLATAIEKLFLSIDPYTYVSTEPVEFKTKHSFI